MTAPTVCSDFGAQENKIYHFFSSIYHEVMGPDMMILVCVFLFVCFLFFWMLSFKPGFHSPLSPSSKGSLVPLHFLPLECIIWYLWSRKWKPSLVFLPGKSYRQRSLVGYRPWSCKESDTTEQLSTSAYLRLLTFFPSILIPACDSSSLKFHIM